MGVLAGPVLLALVAAVAALAAVALAARLYGEDRRSEQAFATGMLFLLGVAIPVHVLGWSQQLTRAKLAATALGLAVVVLGGALARVPEPARFLLAALRRMAATPLVALRLTWRDHSLTFLGLLGTMLLILWTAWLSYLAPVNGWDGLWYHDSIVGFAIQNHGFAAEPSLPLWHSLINYYAKGSEYFHLFPVLLWDRRLIELAPSVFAAIALPGLDALFARFELHLRHRLALACVFVLLPAFCLQLRSTYIDLQVAVVYLAAVYFVTRPELRARDCVMASLCMALLCNAKSSCLPVTMLVFALFSVRVALRFGQRAPLRTALGLALACAVIVSLGGIDYLRNYVWFKNPIYPLPLASKHLGIDWQGPMPVALAEPFREVWKNLLSPPHPDWEYPDTHSNGYGNGPPFVILPVALLGAFAVPLTWLARMRSHTPPEPKLVAIAWLWLLTVLMIPITPSFGWARFALNVTIGGFALFAWCLSYDRKQNLAEGSLVALLLASFLTLLWSEPAWSVPPHVARALWAKTPTERATTRIHNFLPKAKVARAREEELHEGDLVLADSGMDFISLLWNENISNRVELLDVDDVPGSLARIAQRRPKWVAVRTDTPLGEVITADRAHYQRIGTIHDDVIAYRHVE